MDNSSTGSRRSPQEPEQPSQPETRNQIRTLIVRILACLNYADRLCLPHKETEVDWCTIAGQLRAAQTFLDDASVMATEEAVKDLPDSIDTPDMPQIKSLAQSLPPFPQDEAKGGEA